MRITKEFRLEAAHRIPGHPGKCGWLHGHTYRLEVTVEADELNRLGMVVDFDRLAEVVKSAIVNDWDHAALFHRDDPLVPAVAAVQAAAPERLVLFAQNPTVEILAREAFARIVKRLPEGVRLESVTLWETATSSSQYRRGDGA